MYNWAKNFLKLQLDSNKYTLHTYLYGAKSSSSYVYYSTYTRSLYAFRTGTPIFILKYLSAYNLKYQSCPAGQGNKTTY